MMCGSATERGRAAGRTVAAAPMISEGLESRDLQGALHG